MRKERVRWTAVALWLLSAGPVFAGGNQMEGVMGQAVLDLKQVVASGLKSPAPAAAERGDFEDMLLMSVQSVEADAMVVLLHLDPHADREDNEICREIGYFEAHLGQVMLYGGACRNTITVQAYVLTQEIGERAESLGGYCGYPLAQKTPFTSPIAVGDRIELKSQVRAILGKARNLYKMLRS